MNKILIDGWQEPVFAGKRATVLDAALDAGVPLPFGCRSGECGSCKCRLVEGQVTMAPYDKGVLSDQEKAAGLILACRSQPKGDIAIASLTALDVSLVVIPPRRVKAKVVAIDAPVPDVRRLVLRPAEPLPFKAGQYSELTFGSCSPRAYSMASHPNDEELEFHIRILPGGQASGYVAEKLQVGDSVDIDGPFGQAFYRSTHEGPILCAAGGTGLAPVLSIVRTALQENPDRQVHLFFGLRSRANVYAEELLRSMQQTYGNFRTDIILANKEEHEECRSGFVHDAIANDWNSLAGFKVYAAGPPPMIDALTRTVVSLGLESDHIHSDPFYSTAPVVKVGLFGKIKSMLGAK
ncbi:2Fe-2S iron-sulfur cluster-binding protein [Lacibacterium aquatile]|uniref:2Fe-2S iron-sulfur cluster-binding protein n=1 Tax=Lacibacterium aquatile TaxID=1168082 RepID=A0ABW5DKD7_9PROT